MKKKVLSVVILFAAASGFFLNAQSTYAIPPIDKACVYSIEDPGGPISVECKGEGEMCGDSLKCNEPTVE